MDDFTYDCWQKKQLAQQARHRKRGSKSRKCSLPSDNLTKKQWKERNGKTLSINLNQPNKRSCSKVPGRALHECRTARSMGQFLKGEVKPAPAPVQPVASRASVPDKDEIMSMKKVSLSFSGKINASMIVNSLLQILGENASGDVEITCQLCS